MFSGKQKSMKKWIFNSGGRGNAVDISLLLIRIIAGGLMIVRHGYPKLVKLAAGPPYTFADPIGLGEMPSFLLIIFAEFVCAILIIIGLGTRLAAIPLAFAMGVVTLLVNYSQGLPMMELPILFFTLFLVLIIMGAGKYSVDHLISRG